MNSGRMELHILHSNDLHSHLERVPLIAGRIAWFREQYGSDQVIAIDLGDHPDRMNPITEATSGMVNIAILNRIQYDLITLGNNEGLTFAPDQLRTLYQDHIQVPVVVANLLDLNSGKRPDWLKPYHIVQRGSLRIGWIGLTVDFHAFYSLLGWDARDPVKVARAFVDELRPQVDLLFIASHLGIHYDRRLATEIQGIHGIFGSHTHHRFETPEQMGSTWLFAAGKFGQVIGHAVFEWAFEHKQLVAVHGELLPMNEADAPVDTEMIALIEAYTNESLPLLNEPLAMLDESLTIHWSEESRLANLTAHALRVFGGTDIALVNAGVCLHSIEQGPLTKGQLLATCPSPINPCRIRVTGQQILEALELSTDPGQQMKELMGYGFRGKYIGVLAVDGLDIQWDPTRPIGQRIQTVTCTTSGEEIMPHVEYTIMTIDVFTFGVGYPMLGKGQQVEYIVPDLLRDWLAKAFATPQMVEQSSITRWHTIQTKERTNE